MKRISILACLVISASFLNARYIANYDESKIPEYELPEALELLDGSKVN